MRPGIATVALLVTACVQRTDAPTSLPPDMAVSWNRTVLTVAEAEDGFLTLKGLRTAAMMHLAMHDALAATRPRYAPFLLTGERSATNPTAAANEAAYAIVISQYPDREATLGAERERWRDAAVPDSIAAAARALGRKAAATILADRTADAWDAEPSYTWHPMAPGVYAEFAEHSGTPEGFVFGAGWAMVRPFLMDRPDRFRSPPPPAIDSDEYTRAFDEVKGVGRRGSSTRTPDQTHYAMWWKEFVESSHNRLARELVVADRLDLQDATRLFALLNTSVFDGYIASFDSKFFYNHWRPYTAIRWAANDGNPDTEADPGWTNLHDHTYAFPTYPSAHGTVCAAAMTVLADVFGANRPFDMTIPEVDAAGPGSEKVPMDPPTRSFARFADAAEECAMSRVYLGIHFRYDSEEGLALGRKVGTLAVETALTRLPPN